ncbi:hypothetical protein TTY48_21360 [Tsukamurella sp. TY48]|uniref:hypothetical protein n=1 Tax=Tsukamurella strandjordii TaxID=147577 RepID=UPI002088C412|nr:hypothetical protein TTY48_21360 [Tsukamurella sp. TY48]
MDQDGWLACVKATGISVPEERERIVDGQVVSYTRHHLPRIVARAPYEEHDEQRDWVDVEPVSSRGQTWSDIAARQGQLRGFFQARDLTVTLSPADGLSARITFNLTCDQCGQVT